MTRAIRDLLAVDGGPPTRREPFPPWPQFDGEQIEAATAVLRSGRVNYWTGESGRLFEREFAKTVDVPHAVAVANGTLALELALYALRIGPGDEVIVPSRTFVATASAVAMRGASPVFADIDRDSQNVTVETIEAQITPRTRAIIVVHLAGWPCEMDAICRLARRRHLKVVEDCAQALGAAWRGQPVGSLGDMAAFSFCQDKILTTAGEGGMVTTQDSELWERAWSFKDHGKSWSKMASPTSGTNFRFVHDSIGTNWRMTEIQASIGRVGLRRLDEWVATRRGLAARLDQVFRPHRALRVPLPPEEARHSYYKYYAFLRPDSLHSHWSRDRVLEALRAEGIPCGTGTCSEIYEEGAFQAAAGRPSEPFPVARELAQTSIALPIHPTLSASDVGSMAEALIKVLDHSTRGSVRTAA